MIQSFGAAEVWQLIISIKWTIALSLLTFAGGIVGGLLVALARVSRVHATRAIATAYVRLFQGTPLMILLLLAFFAPPAFFGIDVSPWTAALLGFTLYASAGAGEILRSAILAIPRGQTDAARLLGLNRTQRWVHVVLPQALMTALPALVGFAIQLIKATSLASAIGFIELAHTAEIVNSRTFRPFTTFALVAVIYFAMCWPLSLAGKRIEQRRLT